jgi:hypothetical protein
MTSNATRSIKTFGKIKSSAVTPTNQNASTYGTHPISINPAEFDIARGVFQKSGNLSEDAVNAYATLLVEASVRKGVPLLDLVNQVSSTTVGFTREGLSLINYLRPVGSKVGVRHNDNALTVDFILRNIIP